MLRTDVRTDNVKTVYPPQRKFAGGIKIVFLSLKIVFVLANSTDSDEMLHESIIPVWHACSLDKGNFLSENCDYFLILEFKHVFWVLKRSISMRYWTCISISQEYPQHIFFLRNNR